MGNLFTKEQLSEEKIINWKIPNFRAMQEWTSPENKKFVKTFTAGESLKQLSTWNLELTITSNKGLGLFLKLVKSYESGKSVHAQVFTASINGPEFFLIPGSMREYKTDDDGFYCGELVTLNELRSDRAGIWDSVHIQVKIVIDKDTTCTQKMLKENSLNEVSNHFKRLLQTGEYSDFVMRVKDVNSCEYIERKAHRVVLSQSPVFEAMLGAQMLEKETGIVTIEDLTPKGLDILLEFMYTGNLSDDWKLVPEEIINAAEKYQFPHLRAYGDEWLHTACTPDNVFTLLKLAKKLGLSKAFKNISEYIKSNLDNVLNRA